MRAEEDHDAPARATRQLGHVAALDGLRGIAVLLVVLDHSALLTNPFTGQFFYVRRLDQFAAGGALGVDIFFVLSGFLITALLLRDAATHGTIRFGAFYRRRALRLLPALITLLVVHFAYTIAMGSPTKPEITTDWSAILYILNYKALRFGQPISQSMTHLWSLSVEEQFYLLWPAALGLMLGSWRNRRVVAAITAVVVAVALARAQLASATVSIYLLYQRTDTRVDSLLVGALAAFVWSRGYYRPKHRVVALASLATVVILTSIEFSTPQSPWLYYGGFTLFAMAVAVVILAAVDGRWFGSAALELAPLRLVGRVSYGLYLWHLPIFAAVDDHMPHASGRSHVVVAYTVTALVTAASWVLIERPALRWKDRLEARSLAAANV